MVQKWPPDLERLIDKNWYVRWKANLFQAEIWLQRRMDGCEKKKQRRFWPHAVDRNEKVWYYRAFLSTSGGKYKQSCGVFRKTLSVVIEIESNKIELLGWLTQLVAAVDKESLRGASLSL